MQASPLRLQQGLDIEMPCFFDKAITAHALWKDELQRAIARGELPDPVFVGADDNCELGQWIYGEGRLQHDLVEYERLRSLHAAFHQAAANVVEQISRGDQDCALADMRFGQFALTTAKVLNAIGQLQKRLACRPT